MPTKTSMPSKPAAAATFVCATWLIAGMSIGVAQSSAFAQPPISARGETTYRVAEASAPASHSDVQSQQGPSRPASSPAGTLQADTLRAGTSQEGGQPAESAKGVFPALIVPQEEATKTDQAADDGLTGPLVTTISALLIVLAVFGVLVWVSRRYGAVRTSGGVLPEDVAKHLGSTALDAKTRLSFVRIGTRILVIGQTQNGDPQTLTEIDDPEEVERLTNRCLGRPEIVGRRQASNSDSMALRRKLAAG